MSQNDDSENDFVDYKPPRKKKKSREASSASTSVTKRRCTFRKSSKRETPVSVKSPDCTKETADSGGSHSANDLSSLEALNLPSKSSQDADNNAEVSISGDYCPMCQMPFSILVVQSQRWHVSECLDTPRDTCKECPEGLQCSSTIPNHYQKFNHTLLAHSRANCDPVLLSLSQQATSGRTSTSCTAQLVNDEEGGFILESSQDSISGLSAISSCSASTNNNPTGTPPSKLTNGLMFLRSPGPEDFKKKKGWLSSSKSQKPLSSSQESKTDVSSTPVMEESKRQPSEDLPINEPFPNDDFISYSPLSELPAETEVNNSECRKVLFTSDANSDENEEEDSLLLYSDRFSSEDEVLAEFIDHFENNNDQVKEGASLNTQLEMVRSVPPTNQVDVSSLAQKKSDPTSGKDAHSSSTSGITTQSNIQSPQSIVLERLRETLLKSDSLHLQNLNDDSVQFEQFQSTSLPVPLLQNSQTMPPQKLQSKAGQVSSLKQMDIGVFFGLKPHQERQKEAENGPNKLDSTSVPALGENSRVRRPRRERQRKSRTDTTADTSEGLVNENGGNVADTQGEAGKGRSRGWRGRRWNRVNADGEVELPRCPFYKKIPGTKFVVDAFRYGEIEGITAYFLTHFHSDHYGGLTKHSTVPIYCNRITGNLVKSKLKVAEQSIHILPMNTQVTVEGVTVTLLDANHCPGAAMLLFFLPDGQTVLHTGDFRADPSMETYPELLSCSVQTLYLDTTYCSPEYTFPRQQEAINFAASTAFELVTLHPRTLVVCGSYSVGKEKVFLALAEVLGSKVCLSRDKYNTMCCLESEQVKQRITTDWKAAQVHVLPMMQLSFNKLQSHLSRFTQQYDRMVAFKPTGWTFSQQLQSVEDIEPQTSGNISIYGIPYSEHSSFLEMKRFVQWLQPLKIIPTVNNGSWASRKAMEKCFSDWNAEVRAKR